MNIKIILYLERNRWVATDIHVDHANRKMPTTEQNYTTTKHEGQTMVYALEKFRHYLLESHFKMYMNHYALRYLVNKPVLVGGR
jgi:hypothetical protein